MYRLLGYYKTGILFMKYQDAIVKGESFLGHAVLSAAINIGIVSPVEVCLESLSLVHLNLISKDSFNKYWDGMK